MNLQEIIFGLLGDNKMTVQQIVAATLELHPNISTDAIQRAIRHMRGVTICTMYHSPTKTFIFSRMPSIPATKLESSRSASIPASQCEVVAKKVLDGAGIEEVAKLFACKPLTVIRKVQQYCMEQDKELYNSLITGSRKTAAVEDLVQAFTTSH